MRPVFDRSLTVLLAAAVVVGGLELTSYAANGQAFTLGQRNTESRPASLTNSGTGPALSLRARGPALAVGNSRKIISLNADAVDGLSAKALQTHGILYTLPAGGTGTYHLRGVKPGGYLATFSIALDSGTPSRCFLEEESTGQYVASDTQSSDSLYVVTSASTMVRVPSGGGLRVHCEAPVTTAPFLPRTVGLVPLGSMASGSLKAAAKRP